MRLLMLVLLLPLALAPQGMLISDDTYSVGSTVEINVDIVPGIQLVIETPEGIHKYRRISESPVQFVPAVAGDHMVTLRSQDGAILGTERFAVLDTPSLRVTPSKNLYPGDAVSIATKADDTTHELHIQTPQRRLRYVGSFDQPIGYVLEAPGEYRIQLVERPNNVVDEIMLSVASGSGTVAVPEEPAPVAVRLPNGRGVAGKMSRQDSRFVPARGPVKAITVVDDNPSPIGLDFLPTVRVNNTLASDGFVIDPQGKNLTVTFRATGRMLYKCAEWNFTAGYCYGSWKPLMNLTPGKLYTIDVNGSDPAFAQGLTTVNSDKATYLANETAYITMVVLDADGRPVFDANLTLNITGPGGSTLVAHPGAVVQEDGFYAYNYTAAGEGTYEMFVQAQTPGGLVNMSNFFLVNNSFPYTIQRNIPPVIDPFQERLNASILVSGPGSYTFTEVLPEDVLNITAPGAVITTDGTAWYVTWNVTGGATLTYSLDAPQISPGVLVLGPAVVNASAVYEEVRPFYVALDPELTDTGMSVSVSSIEQGNDVNATGNLFCTNTGGSPPSFTVWLEDDGSRIDTTSSGRDLYCAGASSVTILTCEAQSCTVNADCSVDVSNCGRNDDVDIQWELTAQGENDTLTSTNNLQMDATTGTLNDNVDLDITADTTNPSVTLNQPPVDYVNDTGDPLNITFNCSATDNFALSNITLYLTNASNQSFAANGTCSVSGTDSSCQLTRQLSVGNYSWNCLASDGQSNTAFASVNRSVRLNFTEVDDPPSVTLVSPGDVSTDGDGDIVFQCNATDVSDITNVSLYTNVSGSWSLYNTTSYPGGSDINTTSNFTIDGVANNTDLDWNCLAFDDAGQSSFADTNYSLTVQYLPEQPNVTLVVPSNGSTENLEPVQFNCSATDNNDIASINLFSNRTGSFAFEDTEQFPGTSDSDVSASFSVSGFSDGQSVAWNCKAIDNNSNEQFAQGNYTVNIDFLEPNVTLNSPSDFGYDLDGNLSLNCSATDNTDVVNISLYHNISGTWQLNQTTSFPGGSDTDVSAAFPVNNVPRDSLFMWNCFSTDSDGFTDWGPTNYSVTIPPDGTHYFAPDGSNGGTWPNSNRADEPPDGVTANADLDSQLTLFTYNYSSLPSAGTLLEAYFSMRWSVATTPTDDELGLQYSIGGSSYNSLDGTPTAFTEPSMYPTSPTNYSYPVTTSLTLSDLSDIYFRATGIKNAGPDDTSTLVDSIWLTARISPPPQYTGYGKNDSIIFTNDTVQFWSYWIDDISLDCFTFSTNQSGTWVNSSCTNLLGKEDNATYDLFINATAGTTVAWRFYAQDNFGDINATPVQQFVVSDANDVTPPQIYNVSANPILNRSLTDFNLSADIIDNIGVASAVVEVITPSGDATNYSMAQAAGNSWFASVRGYEGGSYSFRVFAYDGNNNSNTSSINQFNVTALMRTDKPYYQHGEIVRIRGYGFSDSTDATIDVFNTTNASVSGFPVNVTANTSGNVSTTWTVPSSLTFRTGNYTASGNDTNTSTGLYAENSFLVVYKPDTASKIDDVSGGDSVKGDVNESDENVTILVGDTAEAYIQLRYQDIIAAGYTLDQLLLYVEHQDLDPESDTIDVQIYDGTTWGAAQCVSLPFRSTETIDVCNLTANISVLPDLNDIRIRLSDGNGGNDGVNFANIDFAYLDVVASITSSLSVTIDEPTNTESTYDFTETGSNSAYDGPVTADPPGSQVTGTEASTSEYTALENSDNSRFQTTVTTSGQSPYQSFYFTVSEAEADIITLTLTHEGYATQRTSLTADPYRIYLWDYVAGTYDLISSDPITAAGSDQVTEIEIATAVTDYVASNGSVNVLIVGDYTLGGCGNPANCRGDIFTDFVSLSVESLSTITGLQDINVTAIDGDGVLACNYTYSNATQTFSTYGLSNVSTILWTNTSDTAQYADGVYNITANCTDGTEINDTEFVTVRVTNEAPQLLLVAPVNNTNFTQSSMNFTWNATSSSGNPLCDLFIDGNENISDVVSASGQNTTRQVSNLADGVHTWYVRCNVNDGAYNTTSARTFTVDVAGPSVSLDAPANNTDTNNSLVEFNYTPVDSSSITNCSLYIDGSFNQSNTSITNNDTNTFTETLSDGAHTWQVRCQDSFGFVGQSGNNTVNVDTGLPNVQLSSPTPGQLFLGGLVQFNYTVTDALDDSLLCNITIDDVVEDSNIVSTNGSPVIRNLVVGDGIKFWNVTCVDDAGNINTSETRNFTVQGPPTVTLIDPTANESVNSTSVDFIYYAEDLDGISNCSLYVNGALNQTNSSVQNGSNNNFTETFEEGFHNWTVECVDNGDRSTQPNYRNFSVDITAPTINLSAPDNDTSQTTQDVTFNFTVLDNLDSTLVCNLTVEGSVNPTNRNFIANNGTLTSRNQTLSPGTNEWNITCRDDAFNYVYSETRSIFIGGQTVITLNSPENDTQELADVVFNYTPVDDFGLQSCSLYLNGAFNQTNSSISNNESNTFAVSFSGEQSVSWYVNCTNDDSIVTISDTYEFYVDLTAPTVTPNYPVDDVVSTSTVSFNFTATDNNATSLVCSLYVNGTLNQSGISATSGQPEIVPVGGFSAGNYDWDVSCLDNATNQGNSSVSNFTVSFGPSVSLQYPPNNTVTNASDVLFNFTVFSNQNLSQCVLYFDGSINQTLNQSEILHVSDGLPNNFTVENISEGARDWTVQCTDVLNVSSTIDENRTIHIDRNAPNVSLHNPNESENVSLSFVNFNWTVTDTVDSLLSCNVSVYNNGTLNKSATNVSSVNGSPTNQTITNFTTGTYQWNVTCTDGLFSQSSVTRNFTVSNVPKVLLQTPSEGYSDDDGLLNFSYIPQTIADGGWQFCQLIIDGSVNDTDVVVENGVLNTFQNVSFPTSGSHTWQVNCTDQDSLNATGGPRNFSVDLADPSVNATAPNGTTLNSTVTFNFTAFDNLDTNLSCDLYINATLNATTFALNNTPRLYSVADFNDSFYLWNLTCFDDALRSGSSQTLNFTVNEPPHVSLASPANQTRNNTQNWTFVYTPTDNSGDIQNCSFIFNGSVNDTNTSMTEGVQTNFSTQNLTDGTYNWSVSCVDPKGNIGQNGTRVFYVDFTGPEINLTYPDEGNLFNQDDITFNWTAADFNGTALSCSLYLDGNLNVSGLNGTSPHNFTTVVSNISDGDHNWSVNCSDDLGNTAVSVTRNFTINQPDLYIDNNELSLNNTNPVLNETINISANVSNIGGRDATNVTVEFWDGTPASGTLIGIDNRTVNVNQSIIFSTLWNITEGYHNIYVIVDPNNTIGELNETNNNATINISALWVNVTAPANNSFTNQAITQVNFTSRDYTGGSINYTFFIDGTPGPSGTTSDGNVTIANVTLTEGNRSVVVQVTDQLGRARNSTLRYRVFDATAPQVDFTTTNGTFFNDTTPLIEFNLSDALSNLINYTVFVDGSFETSGTGNNGSSIAVNLSALSEGVHTVTVQGSDVAGNAANYSIDIYVDITAPSISLLAPGPEENFTTTSVQLNFTVTDTVDMILACNVTLDGSVISQANVTNGSTSVTNVTGLSEGSHSWNVTCWDGAAGQILNTNTSETRNFNVFIPPNISLVSPANNTATNNDTVFYYFNVSDNSGIQNCSIYFNGILNQTKSGASITNNATNNFTVGMSEGEFLWNVSCWDNATISSRGSSLTRNITVDKQAPIPAIETADGTYFNTSNVDIDFNITDAFDATIDYIFFVDGISNASGSVTNATSSTETLLGLSEGTHIITLQGTDDAGNAANASNITIYVDVTQPGITLHNPLPAENLSSVNVTFNFTATDNIDTILACTLFVSDSGSYAINASAGVPTLYNLTDISFGQHTWNVTCVDDAGNANQSETRTFTIPAPDLFTNSSYVQLSNSSPIEGDNISINATFFNIGNSTAENITVQFYRGDPNLGGTQIGSNQTISSLAPGENVTLNQTYTVIIGSNELYAIIDPPTATNGSINEENESNNVGLQIIQVGLYNIFSGTTENTLRVADSVYGVLWSWNVSNATGANLFVADIDSNIGFTTLQALSRDVSNISRNEDFNDLDTVLGSSALNDSVNATWTLGGVPLQTRSYGVFGDDIVNVPVVNSTNTTAFQTGILWDTGDGGTEFNGSQDVVFISQINESQTGQQGTYDYELRIPAPMRNYTGATSQVVFYTELE